MDGGSTGHPTAFMGAALIILVWGVTAPIFKFRDTWQLVINTGTTIVTFLMVFLIHKTQNRDSHAVQLKLDALTRAVSGRIMLYSTSKGFKKQTPNGFARTALVRGESDTDTPELKPDSIMPIR